MTSSTVSGVTVREPDDLRRHLLDLRLAQSREDRGRAVAAEQT